MKYLITFIISISAINLLSACESMKKKDTLNSKNKEDTPKLKKPVVRKVWVPDQISGDEFISGHWKYVLEKNAVWTKEK